VTKNIIKEKKKKRKKRTGVRWQLNIQALCLRIDLVAAYPETVGLVYALRRTEVIRKLTRSNYSRHSILTC